MTKKGLHVGLVIGFVLLSSFALKDLVSYDKTIQVNKFNQNYIRDFPSFTVCTSGLFLDPNQLQSGVMNKTPIDLEIQAFIKSESEKNWTSFNMLNQSEFNENTYTANTRRSTNTKGCSIFDCSRRGERKLF